MTRALFVVLMLSAPAVAMAEDTVPPAPLGPPSPLPAPAPPPQPMPAPWYPPPYPSYPSYPSYPPPYPYPYAVVPARPPSPPPTVVEQPEPPYTGPSPSFASWGLALESAQGVATGKFQNTLLAGHVDYRFSTRTTLGGSLAWANLKGKEGRVNAALPCALVTYEKPRPGRSLSFPLQLATGYLTQNGPVARLAAGIAWAVGRRTDLVASIGSMAWVTRDDMLLSLNLGIALRFRPEP